MKTHQCTVFSVIYDEAGGMPSNGLAPGTRCVDVPADWMCPDCGVSRADFEMIEI